VTCISAQFFNDRFYVLFLDNLQALKKMALNRKSLRIYTKVFN